VVRNLYGYELDSERIARLVEKYPAVWLQVKQDLDEFMEWLNHLEPIRKPLIHEKLIRTNVWRLRVDELHRNRPPVLVSR
jgi:hypothetical protein